LRSETVAFVPVALRATGPAARNPLTPRIAVNVSTTTMRVIVS
jgi:hypothetical protein